MFQRQHHVRASSLYTVKFNLRCDSCGYTDSAKFAPERSFGLPDEKMIEELVKWSEENE